MEGRTTSKQYHSLHGWGEGGYNNREKDLGMFY